jgi:two-component system, chemotaxis family, protein-glutamate methylesterase/glutaminase
MVVAPHAICSTALETISMVLMNRTFDCIAIAASTGGPKALLDIFVALRGVPCSKPVFITQHMPKEFTTDFAKQLAKASGRVCVEATHGTAVQPGTLYIAPGDFHMQVVHEKNLPTIALNQELPENFCRPSADPMLRSLVKYYHKHVLLVVLTGMGSDGLSGARAVHQAGGVVVVQDAATSVVWGMPKAIAEAGLAHAVLPLGEVERVLTRVML